MSLVRPLAVMLGGAAAGLAAYDYIRDKLYPTLSAEDLTGHGSSRVESKEWVKRVLSMRPLRRPPIVITSADQMKPVIKDLDLGAYKDEVLSLVSEITERSSNALALRGKRHDYLVLPKKIHKAVVEHEIGHLRAKEEGKEPAATLLDRLGSLVWHPSFEKVVMAPEKAAWGYVKGKGDGLKEKAMGTYERSFHAGRADLLAPIGTALLTGALLGGRK